MCRVAIDRVQIVRAACTTPDSLLFWDNRSRFSALRDEGIDSPASRQRSMLSEPFHLNL
jgi:hypothetical protein